MFLPRQAFLSVEYNDNDMTADIKNDVSYSVSILSETMDIFVPLYTSKFAAFPFDKYKIIFNSELNFGIKYVSFALKEILNTLSSYN